SEPGFAYAAATSWCQDTNRNIDLPAALDVHAFDDPTGNLSRGLLALGDVHRIVKPQVPNMSVLAMHLYYPQLRIGEGFTDGLATLIDRHRELWLRRNRPGGLRESLGRLERLRDAYLA